MYSPRTDTWESAAPMPTRRQGIVAVVVGSEISAPGAADARGLDATGVDEADRPAGSCDQ